jgi:hypothetical protein
MAGTLTVQNLQGPTSGANANKIIVPSGHTLVPSTGQIVKVTRVENTTVVDHTNQTYTTIWSGSYTPVLTSSTIIFAYNLVLRCYHTSGAEARYNLILNLNGSEAAAFTSIGLYNYSGTGTWKKDIQSNTTEFSNTTGSAVSWQFQTKNIDSQSYVGFSENSNPSTMLILEIAQ